MSKKTKISEKTNIEFNPSKTLAGLVWIWSCDSSAPNAGTSYFRKAFTLTELPVKAEIYLTSDNENSVFINGHFAGSNSEWKVVSSYNLKPFLKKGKNILAIQVVNEGPASSPAGLIGKIIFQNSHGKIKEIPIDKSFKCSENYTQNWKSESFDDNSWQNAYEIKKYGLSPWGIFDFVDDADKRFPKFIIPKYQKEMDLLRDLFLLHYSSPILGTFNMQWVAESTIWPAVKPIKNNPKTVSYEKAISGRKLSNEGYVSCHQHRGLGLPDGWPFPTWWQTRGKGWHFAKDKIYNSPLTKNVENWEKKNVKSISLNEKSGWVIELTSSNSSIESPEISVKGIAIPYVRMDWNCESFKNLNLYLEWATSTRNKFSAKRRVSGVTVESDTGDLFTVFPLHKCNDWKTNDTITKIRICFGNKKPEKLKIQSIFSAVDTRHDVNNMIYLQACDNFIKWTGSKAFLKKNIKKMRKALAYAINEFQVESNKCVSVPWLGHDGRSGLYFDKDGKKHIRYGIGIGSGYWDIMPFGGRDALATIYLYDVLNKMADLEERIAKHPEWEIAKDKNTYSPAKLRKLASEVKNNSTQFWNKATERFGAARDCEDVLHDYGYTFVNCEAIYYDYANKVQSTKIVDWIRGKRLIENDTSTGKDIYKFRFAPRASTKRNLEYYNYVWTNPESIPFGGQVQDGGAVLGFSYHDLMARLKTVGPDDAWQRLKEIIRWFADVQKEGDYREYYKNHPEAGTLQGGGQAGGLGLDHEFFESALLPQVMIYGFLGFQPKIDGFYIEPRLPRDWPYLKITKINLHGNVLDITAQRDKIEIDIKEITAPELLQTEKIYFPSWVKEISYYDQSGKLISTIQNKGKPVALFVSNCGSVVLH